MYIYAHMYMYHGTSRHTCISCFHHPPHTNLHSMLASTSFSNHRPYQCTRSAPVFGAPQAVHVKCF